MRRALTVSVLLVACSASLAAQEVIFHGNRAFSSSELRGFLALSEDDGDSVVLANRLRALEDSMIARDFLLARVDSVARTTDRRQRGTLHIWIHEGRPGRVAEVIWLGDSARVPVTAQQRMLCRSGLEFRWTNVSRDANMIVEQMENHGYPFARVDVDWAVTDSSVPEIGTRFLISSGPLTQIDFVEFPGNRTTRTGLLRRETRLRTGELYDQRRIENARRRLARLEFIRRTARPTIALDGTGRSGVLFPVEEARATRLDAVAGFLPATESSGAAVTGLVNLEFLNLFGSGRRARVHWERPREQIQAVDLAYREPWILGRPAALRLDFGQRVEDTSYVYRRIAVRVELEFGIRTTIWGTVQSESVFTDSAASARLALPDNRTTYTETGFAFDMRDHPTNPRGGVFFSTYAGTGWRKRDRREDGLKGGSFRHHRVGIDSEVAQELFPFWIADLSVHARALETTEPEVLLPDLYRLGGARTLRGYREEQFLGSRVGWGSAELRYWLGAASRVFAFCDAGGIYRERMEASGPVARTLTRIGAGVGLRIETNLGVWGFDYGVGEDDRLLSGKIHVSLLSTF